jgi:hypothetical protein
MNAEMLFPGPLSEVYDAVRDRMRALGPDVTEEFTRTQVSYGATRKFVWLLPLTKKKALLLLDMWSEHDGEFVRNVIRYRDDKFTHQIEVQSAADVDAVAARGWFDESAAWGRKQRPAQG